ncbi:MAG TPA: permease [Candidatus Baltobacteraceae bacterium]|nr:permease [Candidatus Baltobacteraceae bacterium]
MLVLSSLAAGLLQSLQFFWDSLFGLIFGFLISAVVQVVLTPATMHRYLGGNLRGVVNAAGFGIIASACSYGASAAAKGFYQRGADIRAVFSFLISSTNMNLAILILFWSLLGWKFAFAEFFGGVIIIAVVVAGFSVIFGREELERLRRERPAPAGVPAGIVTECPICGMEGEPDLAVTYMGRTYLACGQKHARDLAAEPGRWLGDGNDAAAGAAGWGALRDPATWRTIAETAQSDVAMLRNELLIGYLVAGFAAALIPPEWFAHTLQTVGAVPYIGYVLLLVVGLALAVVSFICSMGNVPIARFLAQAGIPLGANTTFIYGDLLIPPLIAIYMKAFPARVVQWFIVLFIIGAMIAGAIMERAIGDVFGGVSMGSMELNDHVTLVLNIVGILAVAFVFVASRAARSETAS